MTELLESIHRDNIPRVPGTAVFLTRTTADTPQVMLWRVVIVAFMLRNSAQTAGFFRLPREGVVEIGRQIEI